MAKGKTYGVGIMGAGNISSAYLRLAPQFKGLEVRGVADIIPAAAKKRSEDDAHDGATERDFQLRSGIVRFTGDLCHTTDEEQGDARHRNAAALAHETMPQLVQKDAQEKEQHRCRAEDEIERSGAIRQFARKEIAG